MIKADNLFRRADTCQGLPQPIQRDKRHAFSFGLTRHMLAQFGDDFVHIIALALCQDVDLAQVGIEVSGGFRCPFSHGAYPYYG